MPTLNLEPITAEAFAPFGQVMPARSVGQAPRLELIDELQNLRRSGGPRVAIVSVAPKQLPLTAVEMERHIFSSQAFIPSECASYLVIVAPHSENNAPDLTRMRAFRVPGATGINHHADTWHHPLTALDAPARFVVLTFVDGTETDEEFRPLPAPVTIAG